MNKKYILGGLIILIILIAFVLFNKSQQSTPITKNTQVVPVEKVIPQTKINTATTSDKTKITIATSTSYTIADIKKHNNEKDCWMAINKKVYDVTLFIASGKHNPQILKGCGLEATSMFSKIGKHNNAKVQGMMPGFVIGDLK